jgi:hypothetical protein
MDDDRLVITDTVHATTSQPIRLESRVGVGQELLEVRLEPGACLRSGLEGVGLPAVEVVPGGALVAGAVRLAARLDPDEGILELEARVGGGAEAKTGSSGVLVSVNYFRPSLLRMSTYKALHQSPHAAAFRVSYQSTKGVVSYK